VPRDAAARARIGSSSYWEQDVHALGLKAAAVSTGMGIELASPPTRTPDVAIRRTAVNAARRTSASTPSERKISMVRALIPVARGKIEVPGCRSTVSDSTP
jgi:hypothetical protein